MRKRILLLNTSFKYEGPNDVFWQLACHIDSRRFEIIFGCMHEGGAMEKIYVDAGYKVHNFRMERFTDVGAIQRVREFVKSEKIDLVMAQLLRAEVFGGFGVWLAKVPLILVIQNIDAYRIKPWLFPHYYLSRLSMYWPYKIVASSEYVRQFVIRHQGVRDKYTVTIHNGIDPEQFNKLAEEKMSVRNEFNVRPDEIVFGTVARYDPQKGLLHLLKAFASLSSRYENIRLILIGDGPQREELKAWVKKENIDNRVTLAGFRRDYDRILQGFDIFVLPSIWEGLPLALLGAMASSKPAISTTVSGIPEVIENGLNGLLVPPANSMAIAQEMERLILDPKFAENLGIRARENIQTRFSARSMAEKYESLWNECLNSQDYIN